MKRSKIDYNRIKSTYKNYYSSIKTRISQKFIAFSIFVAIATFFWILNALSKEYTHDVSYPVEYINLPTNKQLSNKLPEKITLNVKTHGFTLLRNLITSSFSSIKFNVNSFTNNEMQKKDLYKFNITTDKFLNQISKQFTSEIEIVSIKPYNIEFVFEKVLTKKVPVISKVNKEFAPQYQQFEIDTIKPDSIFITGVKSLIDSINNVHTVKHKIINIKKTITEEIKLAKINGIRFSQDEVEYVIPAESFTEGNITVDVKTINVPDSLRLKLFPSKINVTYIVGLGNYKKIRSDQFIAEVNYRDINMETNEIIVKLRKQPSNIKSVRFSANNIEFIIEKK